MHPVFATLPPALTGLPLTVGQTVPAAVPQPGQGYLPQEDALILQARDLGKSWADITAMLPGRSSKSIRRRYTEHLRPKVLSMP